MSSWISFMRSVQGRKFNRIPDEKYGLSRPPKLMSGTKSGPSVKHCTDCIVEHPVQVPFIRLQLHGPSMNISSCVCRASLWTNGGNAQKHFGFLSNSIEETGWSDIGAVVSAFKFPVCSVNCVRQGWYIFLDVIQLDIYPAAFAWTTLDVIQSGTILHAVIIEKGRLPLGNSFTREMCQCLNQLSVLEQQEATPWPIADLNTGIISGKGATYH